MTLHGQAAIDALANAGVRALLPSCRGFERYVQDVQVMVFEICSSNKQQWRLLQQPHVAAAIGGLGIKFDCTAACCVRVSKHAMAERSKV